MQRACERPERTTLARMEALFAFAAALLALRLAGRLAGRWRARHAPELLAWSASLVAYAVAAAALAWGAAADWTEAAFRVYYLFGGLLTAPLLGAGSLLLLGRRWVIPVVLVYAGLAVGAAVAEPLTAEVERRRDSRGPGSSRLLPAQDPRDRRKHRRDAGRRRRGRSLVPPPAHRDESHRGRRARRRRGERRSRPGSSENCRFLCPCVSVSLRRIYDFQRKAPVFVAWLGA